MQLFSDLHQLILAGLQLNFPILIPGDFCFKHLDFFSQLGYFLLKRKILFLFLCQLLRNFSNF